MEPAKPAWEPTEKQVEFLSCQDFEVLYGGAAGGGKSVAMLIDALGGVEGAPKAPKYQAILIRRTYSQLRDLIRNSRELYPLCIPGASFNEQSREWRFPSGAKVIFGFLDTDADKYQYQGWEFNWVGFDELTQWPTPDAYEYMTSRLRSTDPNLPCYLRATTNPGGVGHEWVRRRFDIGDDGDATVQEITFGGTTTHRSFIPAKLADNKYLEKTGYRERLMAMSEMESRALLDGRWDVIKVEGGIYNKEIAAVHATGRVGLVPHDLLLPVDTFWDLGVRDVTSIIFVQQVAREIRIIDYHEAAGEGLPYFAKVLSEKPYVYRNHTAPHDIAVRELGTGKSRMEIAHKLGIRFRVCAMLPFDDGIHAARVIMDRVWFDKKKAGKLLECLGGYRWTTNRHIGGFTGSAVHDWASHGADAFRYMAVSIAKPSDTGNTRLKNRKRNWKCL